MSNEVIALKEVLIEFFESLGIAHAFGITGGPISPFVEALSKRSQIKVFHFKHETGAAYAALEASLSLRKPVLVFVTTGPGITNALTGILAARSEGAHVIVVSGASGPRERGRFVSQDTSKHSFTHSLLSNHQIFDFSMSLDQEEDLDLCMVRLAQGCQRPNGFVAHIGISTAIQNKIVQHRWQQRPTLEMNVSGSSSKAIKRCVDLLSESNFAVWAGFGTRHAWQELRSLVEATNAKVLCTPRAKGVIPANHPNFFGMTGLACADVVEEHFARHPVDYMLVLGTRLGEASSFWSTSFVPKKGFIHVDLNPQSVFAAYPNTPTTAIQSEIGEFLSAFLSAWQGGKQVRIPFEPLARPNDLSHFKAKDTETVRPSFLMNAIQKLIVDKTESVVHVDVGNAFSFANRYLRFSHPGRYRVQFDFGSMGCASAGVIGTAIASPHKAVAVVGDGALLMNNEINTAVRYDLNCMWIVLNDACYGMVAQGLEALYGDRGDCDFPRCDFAKAAEALGAKGLKVSRESQLPGALEEAMAYAGPILVDVAIDRSEKAPSAKRFMSLSKQIKSEVNAK